MPSQPLDSIVALIDEYLAELWIAAANGHTSEILHEFASGIWLHVNNLCRLPVNIVDNG